MEMKSQNLRSGTMWTKCFWHSPTGRSQNHVGSIMGGDTLGRLEDTQAPKQLQDHKARCPETSLKTFRARTKEVGEDVEVQDSTNLEVGGDLPLGEGGDPPVEKQNGNRTTEIGMTNSPLAQEHIKINRDGGRITGKSREMLTDLPDPKEMNHPDLKEMNPPDLKERLPIDHKEMTPQDLRETII